jgi:hypothetical protein
LTSWDTWSWIVEPLFQVLTEGEDTNAVAIASKESFRGWTKTLTDPSSAPPSSTG